MAKSNVMTGRERIRAAMALKPVDRIPWLPFVGCHGGALIGKKAGDYLRSADRMAAGAAEAVRRYRPDGLPVAFDLQIEAEALGCSLVWSDENPPAVSSHPLASGRAFSDLRIPAKDEGRIPVVLEASRMMRKAHPDIALYGLITGPFTLAMHLYGTDLFMKMLEDEKSVHDLLAFTRDVGLRMADYYTDAGCDVIAVVDPLTSQIGPDAFQKFVRNPASALFSHIRSSGRQGSFFVCGHAQQNITEMCACKPDNISIDENIPLDYVRDICLENRISFGGNLQLTVVLLLGSPDDARRNAVECLETGGETGFILAPGCDLPYATPPSNIEAIAVMLQDPYQLEIAKALKTGPKTRDLLDMSDYGQTGKVIVDIITLDSEACAPCQYMVESVRQVAPEFEGIVEWREHKIKHADSVQFMTSLMVKNIPTICIDGRIAFVSQIPPRERLIAAIRRRIYEKLQYKIRTRRGEILILGKNDAECDRAMPVLAQALRELGVEMPVTAVTDPGQILSYGVAVTPAVVMVHYKVKAEGNVPAAAIIKEWIKEIQ
ncbi:thioredoxin family protein [bacterium]|nr:thioredoxin family protein [bacterium]